MYGYVDAVRQIGCSILGKKSQAVAIENALLTIVVVSEVEIERLKNRPDFQTWKTTPRLPVRVEEVKLTEVA